jgi:hypothetical protein
LGWFIVPFNIIIPRARDILIYLRL